MPSWIRKIAELNKQSRFVKVAEARKIDSCLEFSVSQQTYYMIFEDLKDIVSGSSLAVPIYVLREKQK